MSPTRDEIEAIRIYTQLIDDGYLIKSDGVFWMVTEPKERPMPQQGQALRSLREVAVWANAAEAIRFANNIKS